jgi:hypothetical protein
MKTVIPVVCQRYAQERRRTPPANANSFAPEAVVTLGNVHDSIAFDNVYDKVTASFPEIETVVADSACKTPCICKKVFDDEGRP